MKEIIKQFTEIIKILPSTIEEYMYNSATNIQASNIKSMSLQNDEIWLI